MTTESVSQDRMVELLKGCTGGERVVVDYDGATYTGQVAGTSGVGIIFKASDTAEAPETRRSHPPEDVQGVEIQFNYVRELEREGVSYVPIL
ncbi:hypothetical protein GCM10027040_23850 [Halomonas shantousis]